VWRINWLTSEKFLKNFWNTVETCEHCSDVSRVKFSRVKNFCEDSAQPCEEVSAGWLVFNNNTVQPFQRKNTVEPCQEINTVQPCQTLLILFSRVKVFSAASNICTVQPGQVYFLFSRVTSSDVWTRQPCELLLLFGRFNIWISLFSRVNIQTCQNLLVILNFKLFKIFQFLINQKYQKYF